MLFANFSVQAKTIGKLLWTAELDKTDSNYVAFSINPTLLIESGYSFVGAIRCKVAIYGESQKLSEQTFTIDAYNLKKEENLRYGKHGYSQAKKVIGIIASYKVSEIGTTYLCPGGDCGTPQEAAATYTGDCSSYTNLFQGKIREDSNSYYPAKGYHWKFPGVKGNYCVEMNEGLTKTSDGKWRPANGYKWLNKAEGDLRVVRINSFK